MYLKSTQSIDLKRKIRGQILNNILNLYSDMLTCFFCQFLTIKVDLEDLMGECKHILAVNVIYTLII